MQDPTVLQAKRFGVFSCRNDAPLLEAAQLMTQEQISALVVVDEGGSLVGIITRVDLLKAHDSRTDWKTAPVEEFMNPQVVTVTASTRLSQVSRILLDKGIHRVVVVQEEGGKARPVGVVAAADLLYHMVKQA